MLLAANQHVSQARCCGASFSTTMTSLENRLQHQQRQDTALGSVGRPSTHPTHKHPAVPNGKSFAQPCAASTAAAQHSETSYSAQKAGAAAAAPGSVKLSAAPQILLPNLPAGPSAASSPVTPSAVDVPWSASASPPTPKHASAAQPGPQQSAQTAAAAAHASTRHRLEGSLLLSHLLPLSASLDVALAARDIPRMHAVLTFLQSMPVTGQLLYASQVAKPVRGILQQQMQLQTQHMRQQGQAQGQGVLEEVVGAARLLLRRWKALLAAEVEASDEYRTSKAQQHLRAAQRKQKARQSKAGAAAEHPIPQQQQLQQLQQQDRRGHMQVQAQAQHIQPGKPSCVVQQRSSLQQPTTATQPKRTYSDWLREQQQQQLVQAGRQAAEAAHVCPPRPPKQQKLGHTHTPTHSQQQMLQQANHPPGAAAAPAGMSSAQRGNSSQVTGVAAAAAAGGGGSVGSGGMSLGRSSSDFSLGTGPNSSTGDLLNMEIDWEAALPDFGAVAAAAADAAIGAGGFSGGAGGVEGAWGVGEGDEGELLVDGPGTLQCQAQEAAAFML